MAGKNKPKAYGQFDQGPGQKYADKGKKKDSGRGRQDSGSTKRASTSKADTGPSYEDKVRSDMKSYRSRVMRFGRPADDQDED